MKRGVMVSSILAGGLCLGASIPATADPGAHKGEMGCPMGGMSSRMQGMGRMPGVGGMHGMGRMHMGRMHMGRMQGMQGMGRMHGMGGVHGGGSMHNAPVMGAGGPMADMGQIHTLLANHDSIQRSVKLLPNGVETVTTSRDGKIAELLPQHVAAMYARLKEGRLIRGFDPLFVELFRNADRLDLTIEKLEDGVRVVETSRDPYAVKLIQAHAKAVDGFVRDGMGAMHRTHPVPAQ
jgi:uncharacterized protein